MGSISRRPEDGAHADWWGRLIGRIDAKDSKGFCEFLGDEAEFRFGSAEPIRGKDAIEAAVAGFFDTIAQSRHLIEHTWQDSVTRVCQGSVTYTRRDGSQLTLPFVNVFYMNGELVRRYLIYIDIALLYSAPP